MPALFATAIAAIVGGLLGLAVTLWNTDLSSHVPLALAILFAGYWLIHDVESQMSLEDMLLALPRLLLKRSNNGNSWD